MTKARAYGYAHYITDVEAAKPVALANLQHMIRRTEGVYLSIRRVDEAGNSVFGAEAFLPGLPEHEVDPSLVEFTVYTHGGKHLQAAYTFDYPEES